MNNKNNISEYKWGLFYFNPDDENLIASKPEAFLGWTINFAKPLAYIFMLLVFLLIILISRLFK